MDGGCRLLGDDLVDDVGRDADLVDRHRARACERTDEVLHPGVLVGDEQGRAASGNVVGDLVGVLLVQSAGRVHVDLGEGSVLLIIDDKTEAQRLDETRRDFIANISHELKTPIGAISLLAEALQDAGDSPEMVTKFSKDLYRESKRLGALVKDIIQLSRLQSAEVASGAQVIELHEVIDEAVELNRHAAEARKVRIGVDAPGEIYVYGDRSMLVTAVRNLIENAITYSDDNSQVGIGLAVSQNVAELAVSDSGIGISPEDQKRVFERFYRVDPSRSRETGGTGLGLSIVKHVAHNHRGEVAVFSKPGVGSTFTLRIPVAGAAVVGKSKSDKKAVKKSAKKKSGKKDKK